MNAATRPMGDRIKELSDAKCVIGALLVANNGPTPYHYLMKQYQAQEGRPIPYRRFGFVDCVSFLESLTDTVLVQRNGNNVLLSAKIGDNLRHVHSLVQAQKPREPRPTPTRAKARMRASAPKLPDFVQKNLMQLMSEKGANVRALRDVYFRRFGMSLDVEHYGFASLDDCLARLNIRSPAEKELEDSRIQKEVVALLEQYPEGLYMSHFAEVSARMWGKPLPEGTMNFVRRCPSLFRVERRDPRGDFILLPATDVESPRSLPSSSPLPAESLVHVTHVRSPTEVAVRQESETLRDLTRSMKEFYGTTPKNPPGPLDASVGRLCAAFVEDSWLRSRVITSLVGDNFVEVDLLDTGEHRWVERRHLRPLAPRFADLPAQCTVIQLDLPEGVDAWHKTAGERLRGLAENRQLTCHVINEEETPPRAQLMDDDGKPLSALLDAEGFCKRASRHIQITSTFGLHVVRLSSRRYIFACDLSGLLGWQGDSALQELERRNIHFEVQHLQRDRDTDSWRLVAPLLPEDVDSVFLFPADNVVDAVNVLAFPHIELSVEMRHKLSRVDDDW